MSSNVSLEESMKRLYQWQEDAQNVRVEPCDCSRRASMLSYTFPDGGWAEHPNTDYEYCGYFCATCRFSAAGVRTREKRVDKRVL